MTDELYVNVYERDGDGVEQLVYRPMNDAELAQRDVDAAQSSQALQSPNTVATGMADTISAAVDAVPDDGSVADLKAAIVSALAPYRA